MSIHLEPGALGMHSGCDSLDRTTSEHCVLITSLRALASLEVLISAPPSEVMTKAFCTLKLSELADNLVFAARMALFDSDLGVFVSGSSR